MIDFGLTKIMLIGVVALVVIGPEKLPKVARMAGSLYGRAQRYMSAVKAEVSREMEFDELRKMHEEVQHATSAIHQDIHRNIAETEDDLNAAWRGNQMERSIAAARLENLPPDTEQMARKARNFRKKKLARGAIPNWYKNQHGHKTKVISAAARVARYRPSTGVKPGFF